MIAASISRRAVANVLRTQVLPRVASENMPLILAFPPSVAPGSHTTPRVAPLLRTIRKASDYITAAQWVEEGFNSARYPILVWVAEGEADFRIGVTRRMVLQNRGLSSKHGYYMATLPLHSLFVVPPDTPISDASRPHWERPHLSQARSRLLWFHLAPAGVSLHTCTTLGEDHKSSYALFCDEARLLPLAEGLVGELQNRVTHSKALAQHYLAAFFLHLHRALSDSRAPAEAGRALPAEQHRLVAASTPVQRACRYIETTLSQKISVSQIAARAYISPTQLNRLFRSELKASVGEYLAQRRQEQARTLLQSTNLPISHIGTLCGYPNPEYFNQMFRRHNGCSPGAFRRQACSKQA
jgi:AraC-like DNA-binding protein